MPEDLEELQQMPEMVLVHQEEAEQYQPFEPVQALHHPVEAQAQAEFQQAGPQTAQAREQASAGDKVGLHRRDAQAETARLAERRRKTAQRRDRATVRADKLRHGFYGAVKGVVNAWKTVTGRSRSKKQVKENTRYTQSLQMAYDQMYAQRLQAEEDGTLDEFEALHGDYFRRLEEEYQALQEQVAHELESVGPEAQETEYDRRLTQAMQERQAEMDFGAQRRADVVGGTKPAAVQYATDGSKWLVKEAVSCIGVNEPNSALVTEAGYQVQRLVNPDTAIEAFRGQSVGKGVVSYQRMVTGVRQDVDLFKFSRTPDALTDAELARVQELSPQLLREHTTDWLLCNFDTKGENFILANDGTGPDRLYGIDKEAAFRPILDEGAQHMSKDYRRFDQETVYNRLFQKFADGTMDLDLQAVLPQIERVEAMDDEAYMGLFKGYLSQQGLDRPDQVEEIRANILARKQNLRMEYRDFFTRLVQERSAALPEAEAAALRERYFGHDGGGTFLFTGETAEDWQAERERRAALREAQRDKLAEQAAQADKKDQKSYNLRHGFYDFSKGFVMGLKAIADKFKRGRHVEERRETLVPLAQVAAGDEAHRDEAFEQACRAQMEQIQREAEAEVRRDAALAESEELSDAQRAVLEGVVAHKLQTTYIALPMHAPHAVHLGGTKPMSEYYGGDGSRWLAKQAVDCMGYYKLEGALLTEAGARLQRHIDPATAVDAFVGRTREHGDVSFQRRLEHVESGPDKLDLFRFSKHPEIAAPETIAQVQALGPQILREHATDWLLCNFDTKGENFVITRAEGEERVLHGIDKEAAFSKILDPRAQHMSTTYRPHANNTLYNVVYSMYAGGEMDLDLFDALPQIQTVEELDDEAYLETFQGYLEHTQRKYRKEPEKYAQIRANILLRKQNLRQEYCDFFTNLVLERCKALHPDEAAALRERYFGPGGVRFRFPDQEDPGPGAP